MFVLQLGIVKPHLLQTGRLLLKDRSPVPIALFIKECPDCNLPYRYSDTSEGVFNFNDNTIIECSILETIFTRLTLLGHPVSDTVARFVMECQVSLNTNIIREAFMVYIAMKDKSLEYLACHQLCGLNPPIIIFDVKRGLWFDVDHKTKTELKQFKNCSDMLEAISVHSITKVIGKKCVQIHFEF